MKISEGTVDKKEVEKVFKAYKTIYEVHNKLRDPTVGAIKLSDKYIKARETIGGVDSWFAFGKFLEFIEESK